MINGFLKTLLILLPLQGLNEGELKETQLTVPLEQFYVKQNAIDREFLNYRIFLNEKRISNLPDEVKLKKIKKIKNSLIS